MANFHLFAFLHKFMDVIFHSPLQLIIFQPKHHFLREDVMKYSAILSILLVLIVSMFISCDRNPADGNAPKNEITIDLPFQLAIPAHIKDQVQFAKASVSAEDMDTIWTDLTVTEEYVEGVIKNVPAGEDRHFEIFVYDPDSTLTYYGDAYADIQPGKTITLEIVLKPMTTTGTVIIIGYFGEAEGEYIVFCDYSPGNIYRMKPDGKQVVQLTFSDHRDFWPVISPKGDRIVFVRDLGDSYNYNRQIFSMKPDGSDLKRLTFSGVENNNPMFYLDGQKIVYRYRVNYGESGNIYIMNTDGSDTVNVTNDLINPYKPYGAFDEKIYFVTHPPEQGRIYRINSDGTNLEQLSDLVVGAHTPVMFVNDNQNILFDTPGYPNQIGMADFPEFSNVIQLTNGPDINQFSLSPDGNKIIYTAGNDNYSLQVHILDLRTNQITNLGIHACHAFWYNLYF
jgi:Tol biopolymer transport system component